MLTCPGSLLSSWSRFSHPSNNSIRKVLLSSHYRWEDWSLQSFNKSPRVIWIVRDRARTGAPVFLQPIHSANPHSCSCDMSWTDASHTTFTLWFPFSCVCTYTLARDTKPFESRDWGILLISWETHQRVLPLNKGETNGESSLSVHP